MQMNSCYHPNGGSPREFLETLKSPDYFVAKWKVYVPDFNINCDEKFIPRKITMARDDSSRTWHTLYKVIIPRELVTDYDVKLPGEVTAWFSIQI